MVKQGSSTKTVHTVQLPFSDVVWPVVTASLESSILDLLLPLLLPIGKYRSEYVAVSRGEGRKRSRKPAGTISTAEDSLSHQDKDSSKKEPDIAQYLTVGYNSTVRSLESLAREARSTSQTSQHRDDARPTPPISAVFVCVTELPDVMTSPLLLLVATASLKRPVDDSIRIVPMTAASAKKIAQALHQPKVGVLGLIKNASGSENLEQLLRTHVDAVDVPWIREAAGDRYLPARIHSETVTGNSKPQQLKRKRIDD